MPELEILIGGRAFEVACQEGEEHYLQTAAEMLNIEAQTLIAQTGRIPEARMLLMSGLMLADRTAGVEDRLKLMEDESDGLRAEIDRLTTALKRSESLASSAQRVEVPVIPVAVTQTLTTLADQAEALASEVEAKSKKAG
ncbi:cell division protein ZapA [Pseudooceanicola sp.]|uniref:cell division protein ZapA n=1 Tax=Pseudooceanicola sp. TaxID=1914328 RepID=UPI000C09B5C2|nr:cell division protein ZapA [Pseudooceanicola sp.]|tara:strand:- start:4968 stop:5387 length:420 start_codon:yes stop_codon:yes gene_type:complete